MVIRKQYRDPRRKSLRSSIRFSDDVRVHKYFGLTTSPMVRRYPVLPSAIAAGYIATLIVALLIANLRERERDVIASGFQPKERLIYFGWPLISHSQRASDLEKSQLYDQDFTGHEMPPRWSPLVPKCWFHFGKPVVRWFGVGMVLNVCVQAIVIVSSASTACRTRMPWQLSLRSILLWTLCVACLCAFVQSPDSATTGFWDRRVQPLDLLDAACWAVIGGGCACAIHLCVGAIYWLSIRLRKRSIST